MIEIKTLKGIPFDTLYDAFSQAFAIMTLPQLAEKLCK